MVKRLVLLVLMWTLGCAGSPPQAPAVTGEPELTECGKLQLLGMYDDEMLAEWVAACIAPNIPSGGVIEQDSPKIG